ncbi:hypothetical protein [Algoriphagus winogradskyi]|uniref:Uncharacterized protein n=1 Tax=Algoriphagus winogradskyi TaxID=237017 RepID=A0ABY1PGL8_9BACT|nr:hypothetical protein [Algoriphagus winogradskyi]SMP32431.1 hypothetical protein SAMN06265367_10817 [Algoriphagus winogradskyi]
MKKFKLLVVPFLVVMVIVTAVMGGFIYNKNIGKPNFQKASILSQSYFSHS